MRTGRLIVGVISYLAIGSFVLAQTAASVIRGTIQDATGAVLPDVRVTLRDKTRNQSWTQTTNEDFFGVPGRCRSALHRRSGTSPLQKRVDLECRTARKLNT
jgi:hypothetical protein